MSKRRSEPEESRAMQPGAWLPAFLAVLFTAIGLYVAIFELSPAFEEHRAVRAALREQLDSKARLDAEIAVRQKQLQSLEEDPQATQHELDKRGLLPKGASQGMPSGNEGRSAEGSGSQRPDRGQSRD